MKRGQEQDVGQREVLAGADGSSTGAGAADWAAKRADARGLRLHLVRVVPESSYYRMPAQYRSAVAEAQVLLDVERDRMIALHPTLQILTSWQPGEPAPALSLLSVHAEIVVLGSDRSPDTRGEGFGSTSFQAAVLCRSPVAVIPPVSASTGTGVVVGVDGSADSMIALEMAAEEANRTGEILTVLHAVPGMPDPGPVEIGDGRVLDPRALVANAARIIRELFPGLGVREHVEPGDAPADALIRAAGQASLLVIGCWGRGGLRKPLGSVAEQVLLRLPCPVIITRPAIHPAGGSGPSLQ